MSHIQQHPKFNMSIAAYCSGGYQGVMLELAWLHNRRIVFVQEGYGSCSLCCAWQAAQDADEEHLYVEDLYDRAVKFDTPEQALAWLRERDWDGCLPSMDTQEDKVHEFIRECHETLGWHYQKPVRNPAFVRPLKHCLVAFVPEDGAIRSLMLQSMRVPDDLLAGQWKFDFGDGWGASVIRKSGSYGAEEGLFEVAALHNDRVSYDTATIGPDIRGYLDEIEVHDALLDLMDEVRTRGRVT